MRAVDILRKKRDGLALTPAEIDAFVLGATRGDWPGYQTGALLMAIVLRGMDAGETSAESAARELYEETGITDAETGPCIWTMRNEFDFAGFHFDQDEFIHVAWCTDGEYAPAHLEALEAVAFDDGRWWGLDELLTSDVPVLPVKLREYLPPIVAGDLPDEPIDIGDLPPRT